MRSASMIVCIWLSVWAMRKKAGIDDPLDRISAFCRLTIVLIGFLCASIPGARLGALRIAGFVVAIMFLCWPNFAYRITRQQHRDELR